jgi:hypothetical protein
MNLIGAVRRLGSWCRFIGRHDPRLVKRVGISCPHGLGRLEVELLIDRMGKPETVVRCSAHAICPPTCDQACRACAEAVLAPARALIIFPPDGPLRA